MGTARAEAMHDAPRSHVDVRRCVRRPDRLAAGSMLQEARPRRSASPKLALVPQLAAQDEATGLVRFSGARRDHDEECEQFLRQERRFVLWTDAVFAYDSTLSWV